MQLEFPLGHYDESGRLKPPLFLYVLLFFLCRGLLVFVVALSMRDDSERMMTLFYPEKYDFYLSLLPAIPAFLILAMFSRRQAIWKKGKQMIFVGISYLLGTALLLDIALQLYVLNKLEYTFAISRASTLTFALIGTMYLLKSKHVKHLKKDWPTPNVTE